MDCTAHCMPRCKLPGILTKTGKIMRITAILLLGACLQVSARGDAQNVTLSERNVPLQQVFKDIHRQTGFQFFYKDKLLNQAGLVTIEVKNAPLEQVLAQCFQNLPITYTILNKAIVVKEKEIPPLPAISPSSPPLDIHGRVTDSSGAPLSGASVNIKGTKKGTATNEKGEFDLRNVGDNAILVITFTGFEKQEVKLANNPGLKSGAIGSITIRLEHSNSSLDQVQVIAYGTTTERLNVGNVTTVTSKEIEEQPVSNPLLALEGRVPGLFITQNTGVANGEVIARVQGQNSITSGNDPLIVVDGVPISATLSQTGFDGPGAVTTGGTPLSFVNPADIESINVLKDADATAIYGTRAANGAILITTKKGKAGKTKVDVNVQQGGGHVTRKVRMMNTRQYLDMRYEGFRNDEIDWTDPSVSANDLKVYDTTRYTNWQKALIGETGQYTNINAGISGGNQSVQYLIGGTYHRESSVFPGSMSDQKGSLHFSLNDASADQRLKIQFSGNYMVDGNHLPATDLTSTALSMEPDAPMLYNKNGTLNWEPDANGATTFINPLTYTLQTYNNTTKNLISNLQLSYSILPGLDIRSSFGYTNLQANAFLPVPLISIRPEWQAITPRSAQYLYRNFDTWIIEPQLIYKKTIGKGKVEGLLGTTIEQDNSNTLSLQASGFNSDLVLNDIGSAVTIIPSSAILQYKYNALFSRLHFSWLDRYIVNLTARRDGSSHFGDANKFHDFASIGGAWIFSQEEFPRNSKSILSFGKLRASYGTTGNDQISDNSRLSFYSNTTASVPYQNTIGLVPLSLNNPYLEWELTKKIQVGLDLGFLKDRILVDVTYGRNRSSNELLPYALPSTTGFLNVTSNFPATVQNTDWEFSINTINIKTKEFSWKSNFNLTIPRNKVVAFPNIENSSYADGGHGVIIGQPLGVQKVYHYLGVDPATGVYEVADVHGNPTTNPDYTTDRTKLLSTLPRFYGGIINSIGYRGFQLEFLLQFVRQLGTKDLYYYNGGSQIPGMFFRGLSNQPVTVLDRWQKPGDIKPIARYNTDGTIIPWPQPPASDAGFSYNASYIRMKNIAFSWEIPSSWTKKAHFQNGKIYLQGQNLITITKYTGLDPENQSVSSLPPLRVLTFGLQMGF
jgi:TonB-linked SusC/RagA family outer membrane protein